MNTKPLDATPRSFDAMVANGRKAWADVPNASDWVEELRGEYRAPSPELIAAIAADNGGHFNPFAHEQTK